MSYLFQINCISTYPYPFDLEKKKIHGYDDTNIEWHKKSMGTGGIICADTVSASNGCGNWLVQYFGYSEESDCGMFFFFAANTDGGYYRTSYPGCIARANFSISYPNHFIISWNYNTQIANFYINGTLQSNFYPTSYTSVYQCGNSNCGSDWAFPYGIVGTDTQYIKLGCDYPASGLILLPQIWLGFPGLDYLYNPSDVNYFY